MPIKKDESGKRWVEMQLLVPGTPEQVWHALATGPGNSGWFTKTEIDGRVGGTVKFDFGDGTVSAGEVTEWEPPRRFAYLERDWEKGAPPVATEITITARSGGRCVVRMVHALFTSSEAWDDQVEGFESGWAGLFQVLRVYLAHFAEQQTASIWVARMAKSGALETWQRLTEALGLAGANVGERRSASFGAESWTGVVEHVYQDGTQRHCLLRIEQPSSGIALVGVYAQGDGATRVSVARYYYGADAELRADEGDAAWRGWLGKILGPA